MALSFDNTAAVASATTNLSWSHVGAASNVKTVVVQIVQNVQTNDQITNVTYGSLTLTRVSGATVFHTVGAEDGAVYTYIGTAGIPQGTQTVTVTVTASGATKDARSYTLTGAADTQVEGSASLDADAVTNPSVSITARAGVAAWAFGALHSGQNAVGNLAAGAGTSEVEEVDFGNQTASFTRLTSATSGGNVTYAWTASSSPAGIGAVAVSEKQAFTLPSDAGPGSFTVDGGSNTTIVAGRMVTASPGAFVETGSDATLSKTSAPINLTADPGAFDFTGTQASPVAGRAITASPGAYTATGADASPVAGRMVSAAPDAYSVTGSDAGTLAGRMIEAATEAILLSGSDATFELTIPAITISADPGAFVFTGEAAGTVAGFSLSASPDVFTMTGVQASPVSGRMLSLAPDSYTFTGVQASAVTDRMLSLDPTAIDLTGLDADIAVSVMAYELIAEPAVFGVGTPGSGQQFYRGRFSKYYWGV